MLTARPMSRKLKEIQQIFTCPGHRWSCRLLPLTSPLRLRAAFALEDPAVLHHELHILQGFNILQRIAADRDDVGKSSGRYHADLPLHLQHRSWARGCTLYGFHRWHA